MPGKRFYIAWLSASSSMFVLSYIWHGVILNDFSKLPYSEAMFFCLVGLVYLIIGFGLSFTQHILKISSARIPKMAAIGGALGFFVYLIAFTLGVSFNAGSITHVVIDFVWQMLEQASGGVAVAIIYSLAAQRDKLFAG